MIPTMRILLFIAAMLMATSAAIGIYLAQWANAAFCVVLGAVCLYTQDRLGRNG